MRYGQKREDNTEIMDHTKNKRREDRTIKTFKKRVFPLSGSCLRKVLTVVGSHRRSLTSLSTMIGLLLFIRNRKRRQITNFQRLANSYDVCSVEECVRTHAWFVRRVLGQKPENVCWHPEESVKTVVHPPVYSTRNHS